MNSLGEIPKRERDIVDPQLHVFLQQLFDDLIGEHEHDSFALQILDQLGCGLAVRRFSDDDGEARNGEVDELDPVFSKYRVGQKNRSTAQRADLRH